MICIKGVGFQYPDGNNALENINMCVENGENIALVGANGAGKSSLLKLIVGINMATKGTIEILDNVISPKNVNSIRKMVGFVFQNPDDQLFMAKVYDDIAFGPRNFNFPADKIKEAVNEAAEELHVTHLLARTPHKLSGGEKRKVAMAAVLAVDPKVLLLDEPTSFLDPKGRRTMIDLMKGLPQTKIIATHDLEMVLEFCGRMIILKNGKIFAEGNPKELLKDVRLMEKCDLEVPISLMK